MNQIHFDVPNDKIEEVGKILPVFIVATMCLWHKR
jgi:hypothetical protein